MEEALDVFDRYLAAGDSVIVRGSEASDSIRTFLGLASDERAYRVSDALLGEITVPEVEFHRGPYQPVLGERVIYRGLAPQSFLAVGRADGLVVDVASTFGGNVRYRLRTDDAAPQGGGNIEILVYSHSGRFQKA